jgi:hypothetical protein
MKMINKLAPQNRASLQKLVAKLPIIHETEDSLTSLQEPEYPVQ